MSRIFLLIVLTSIAGGCVQRTLTVTSDPEGALVYLNGQEIGRTPVTRDFTWYGTYDVQLRKDGYETLATTAPVIAPIWQWPPFDFAAEFWPGHLKDQRHLSFTLKPATTQPVDPIGIFARALVLRGKLESTERPATQPATHPATRPSPPLP